MGVKSLALRLGTPTSPGPGFFPFWLCVGLAVVAMGLLLADRAATAPGVGAGQAVVAAAAVAGYGLLLEPLGFVLATFVLLAFLWRVVARRPTLRAVAGAAMATAATWLVFDVLLRVRFPRGVLGL
jgi:hypothetical protein